MHFASYVEGYFPQINNLKIYILHKTYIFINFMDETKLHGANK